MNCSAVPKVMIRLAGVTVMDTSVTPDVTVKVVEAEILSKVAVIVVVPTASGVAIPWEPDALLIVATGKADELHSTDVVISCWLPSEKVPVAVNCWAAPTPAPGLAGVMAIETSETGETVRVECPEIFPDVAVIVVVPEATEVAFPCVPAIVATDVADELHVTVDVIS